LLVFSLRQLEAHLQRFQIGVYVAEEKIAQDRIPTQRWRLPGWPWVFPAVKNRRAARRAATCGVTTNARHYIWQTPVASPIIVRPEVCR
jgi:hypothetical protein